MLDFHHHPVVLCQFKLNAMHEVLPFVSSKILMTQLESLSLVAEKITKLTPLTSPSKLEKEWAGGVNCEPVHTRHVLCSNWKP